MVTKEDQLLVNLAQGMVSAMGQTTAALVENERALAQGWARSYLALASYVAAAGRADLLGPFALTLDDAQNFVTETAS